MKSSGNLHILLKARLNEYTFNPHRPEGLSFSPPEGNLHLSIRCDGDPIDFDYGHQNLLVEARTSIVVSEDDIAFVNALFGERYLKASGSVNCLPYTHGDDILIDEDGNIAKGYSPRWDMLPHELQESGAKAYSFLLKSAQRFIGLLRWQLDVAGEVDAIDKDERKPIIYWKTTQESYHLAPLPRPVPLTMAASRGFSWGDREQVDFTKAWIADGLIEPLGHQLLREARQMRGGNDRGALLISYAALEVGVKQHISRMVPLASWLAMNSPSPPLNKVLREYLPIFHEGNPKLQYWRNLKELWKLTTEFVEDRNKLAHKGEAPRNSIDEYINLVSDLLYSLDYIEGQEWARAHISQKNQGILGWQGPARPGVNMTVTVHVPR